MTCDCSFPQNNIIFIFSVEVTLSPWMHGPEDEVGRHRCVLGRWAEAQAESGTFFSSAEMISCTPHIEARAFPSVPLNLLSGLFCVRVHH